jgi:predicted  nucleic acid-binding Zn-ribbon protein
VTDKAAPIPLRGEIGARVECLEVELGLIWEETLRLTGEVPAGSRARVGSLEREFALVREENARLAGELANSVQSAQSLRDEMAELRALVEREVEAMEAIRHWAGEDSHR